MADKPELSQRQMLDRIPEGKEHLTTEEVMYVFNDCHVQTVYKMNQRGEIRPYRKRARGRSNFYLRADVEAAIRARFMLIPTSSDDNTGGGNGGKNSRVRATGSGARTSKKVKKKKKGTSKAK